MADLPVPQSHPIPSVVQQYLDGQSIQELALQYQRSHRTIYNWLLKECGPDYEDTVTDALIARIADADLQLEKAVSPLQIARAREVAKFARMDFERRRPKLYGPKQEIQQDTTIRVVIEPAKPVQLRTPDTQVLDSNVSDIMDAEISG